MRRNVDLDSFDLKLVEAIQKDARLPMAALAESVGLSAPACYRRVRRLREAGVIAREIGIVRPRTLGWPLSMIVLIALEREGEHTLNEMAELLRDQPEVIEAWNVTGDFDIAARMIARDMEGYDESVRRLFSADPRVRTYQTLVVIRQMKALSPVPVG